MKLALDTAAQKTGVSKDSEKQWSCYLCNPEVIFNGNQGKNGWFMNVGHELTQDFRVDYASSSAIFGLFWLDNPN